MGGMGVTAFPRGAKKPDLFSNPLGPSANARVTFVEAGRGQDERVKFLLNHGSCSRPCWKKSANLME